jgi:large subunit ribosomal protein L25
VADYSIEAQPRTITGKKVSQLRTQGLVPVVLYGAKVQPTHLQIPYRPLQIALMKAGGTNLIDINVDGKTHSVIAREVQRNVIRGDILHVDFLVVDATTIISADVPVHLIGESPVVATNQAILLPGASVIRIETIPSKLIHSIEVDVSSLTSIGDSIHVRDLKLADGITILNDPDELVARIAQPSSARAEEDAAEEAAEGSAEVEVISKGKEDEEDF